MAANALTVTFGGSVDLRLLPAEPAPAGYAKLTIRYGNFTATTKGDAMYQFPINHLLVVQVGYVDAGGNPAKVDGAVAWTSSAEDVATVEVDAGDSTICTITSTGKVGTTQVVATADADLGGGVRQLLTTLEVGVVAGEAVAGTINVVTEAQPIAEHVEPR